MLKRKISLSAKRLRQLQTQVVAMYFSGLTSKEVAEELGLGISTVSNLLREPRVMRSAGETQRLSISRGNTCEADLHPLADKLRKRCCGL